MASTKATKTATDEKPRDLALTLLAEGATNVEVARALSVNRGTVWKWRASPDFAARLAQLRQPILDAARRDMAAMAGRAVEVLGTVLDDVSMPPAVRLRAVEMVLERTGLTATDLRDEQPEDIAGIIRYLAETRRDEVEAALAEVSS